jgi:hypothetical protein
MSRLGDVVGSPPFLAALVAAAVSVTLALFARLHERRASQADVFAAAFAAYTDYREFPYVVRRRAGDDAPGERRRISEAMRDVQSRINYHLAWTRVQDRRVGREYAALVGAVRRTAGKTIAAQWQRLPISSDAEMNVPDIDLSELQAYEDDYLAAVEAHLHPWRSAASAAQRQLRFRRA